MQTFKSSSVQDYNRMFEYLPCMSELCDKLGTRNKWPDLYNILLLAENMYLVLKIEIHM